MKTVNFYKLTLVKEKEIPYNNSFKEALTSPEAVVKFVVDYIGLDTFAEEYLYLFALNVKNSINGIAEVSHGALNYSIVHPREVYKYAISMNAASIILVHNHPSGDTTPSKEDIIITKKIQEAGELLEINLLDHIIVSPDGHLSLKEEGLL